MSVDRAAIITTINQKLSEYSARAWEPGDGWEDHGLPDLGGDMFPLVVVAVATILGLVVWNGGDSNDSED